MEQEVLKKPPATVTADSKRALENDIRYRAYASYVERGREDGHDLDDWLRAETELIEAAASAGSPFLSENSAVFQAVYPESQ
jgi:hypothetical protein